MLVVETFRSCSDEAAKAQGRWSAARPNRNFHNRLCWERNRLLANEEIRQDLVHAVGLVHVCRNYVSYGKGRRCCSRVSEMS